MFKKSMSAIMCIVMLFTVMAVFPLTTDAAAPKLNKKKISIRVGKTYKLKLKNAKASKVTWKSSKTSVATVYNGKVTAYKKGTAKVTAKYKGKKYVCKVTVKPKITYFGKVFKVYKDDTYKLVITNSWGLSYNAKKWMSSKKSVATINKDGLVKAKKIGATTITAIDSSDNYLRGTVKVISGTKALKNYINKKGKKNSDGDKTITLKDGDYRSNITYSASKKAFILSGRYSSNSNIVEVSVKIPYKGTKKATFEGYCDYPEYLYATAKAKNVKLKSYDNSKENVKFKITYGDSSDEQRVSEMLNRLLHNSFIDWRSMLKDKLTMGMSVLGFSKYPII